MRLRSSLLALSLLTAATLASAADVAKYDGLLCCNLRTDGSWISDSNYAEDGKRMLPVGTPVSVTGFGRNRVNLKIAGEKQSIGNDYSRDLDNIAFAARYFVTADPKLRLATFPSKIRQAINDGKLTGGMTREQVLMAVGYPISSENPNLEASLWRYWRDSFSEYQVQFGPSGKLVKVTADPQLMNLVWLP
ncbi:hypothetical protein FHT08_003455 [Xanthomonas campestris]|uniref:hypothetical protein n=1 Tax=Xanthomonas sp. CFBP 8151 TaxID=3035310 RepID=UPI00141A9FEB|nr:hypothetical protein [Xanthomonas sp. CFBP 8151]NIJ78321.1 hypothetical protein [Xanthomonas sp. CFBP 8151]